MQRYQNKAKRKEKGALKSGKCGATGWVARGRLLRSLVKKFVGHFGQTSERNGDFCEMKYLKWRIPFALRHLSSCGKACFVSRSAMFRIAKDGLSHLG